MQSIDITKILDVAPNIIQIDRDIHSFLQSKDSDQLVQLSNIFALRRKDALSKGDRQFIIDLLEAALTKLEKNDLSQGDVLVLTSLIFSDTVVDLVNAKILDIDPNYAIRFFEVCTKAYASLRVLLQAEKGLLECYAFQTKSLRTIVDGMEKILSLDRKIFCVTPEFFLDISIVLYFLFRHEQIASCVLEDLAIIRSLSGWVVRLLEEHRFEYEAPCANILLAMISVAKLQFPNGLYFSSGMSDKERQDFLKALDKALFRRHKTLPQNAALLLVFLCFDERMRSVFHENLVLNICNRVGTWELDHLIVLNITMACAQMASFENLCDLMLRDRLGVMTTLYKRLSDKTDVRIVYNALHALSSLVARLTPDMLAELKEKKGKGESVDLGDIKNKVLALVSYPYPVVKQNAITCLLSLTANHPNEFTERQYQSLFESMQNICFSHPTIDGFEIFRGSSLVWFIAGGRLKHFEGTVCFERDGLQAARAYLLIAYIFSGRLPGSILESLRRLLALRNEMLSELVFHIFHVNALYSESFVAASVLRFDSWPSLMGLLNTTGNLNILESGVSLFYYRLGRDRDNSYSELLTRLYHLLPGVKEISTRLYIWNILYRRARLSKSDRYAVGELLKRPPELRSSYEKIFYANVLRYTGGDGPKDKGYSWEWGAKDQTFTFTLRSEPARGLQIQFMPNRDIHVSTLRANRCIVFSAQRNAYDPWAIRIASSEDYQAEAVSVFFVDPSDLRFLVHFSRWISKGWSPSKDGDFIPSSWFEALASLESVEVSGIDREIISQLNECLYAPKKVSLEFKNEKDLKAYEDLFKDSGLPAVDYHGVRTRLARGLTQNESVLSLCQEFGFDETVAAIFKEQVGHVASSFFTDPEAQKLVNSQGSGKSIFLFAWDRTLPLIRSVADASFFWAVAEELVLDFTRMSSKVDYSEVLKYLVDVSVAVKIPINSEDVITIRGNLSWAVERKSEGWRATGKKNGDCVVQGEGSSISLSSDESFGCMLSISNIEPDLISWFKKVREGLPSPLQPTLQKDLFGLFRMIEGFTARDIVLEELKALGSSWLSDLVPKPNYNFITLFSDLRFIDLASCGLENKDLRLLARWISREKAEQNEVLRYMSLEKNKFDRAGFLEFLGLLPKCLALETLKVDFVESKKEPNAELLVKAFGDGGGRFPKLQYLRMPGLFSGVDHPSYAFFSSRFCFPDLKEILLSDRDDENLLQNLKDASFFAVARRSFACILD